MAYEDKLLMIDDAFSDYLKGRYSISQLEKKIASVLAACSFYGRSNKYTIMVVKNQGKEPFFGARIFPAIDDAHKIAEGVVVEGKPVQELRSAWKKIENWVIEIDSSIFDRNTLNLNPREMTAILLHEVGHTIYSDKVIERMYRAYKSAYVHMNIAEKETLKIAYALFMVPLSASCALRSWVRGRNAIKEEYFADKIVADNGYGENYVEALTKIIEAFGNSIVNTNNAEADADVETSIQWAMVNVCDMTKRKNRLKDELFYKTVKSSSGFLKALAVKILNELGVNMREKYTGDVVECTLDLFSMDNVEKAYEVNFDTAAYMQFDGMLERSLHADRYTPGTAAFESFRRNRVPDKLPSWEEVDKIKIEYDRMTNHYDRTFVLDLIYDLINQINEFMESIEDNPSKVRKFKPEADKMLAELEDLRRLVLRKSSFAKRYQVFVKVPDGYEG